MEQSIGEGFLLALIACFLSDVTEIISHRCNGTFRVAHWSDNQAQNSSLLFCVSAQLVHLGRRHRNLRWIDLVRGARYDRLLARVCSGRLCVPHQVLARSDSEDMRINLVPS